MILNNTYPPSVKPGIPKLGRKPKGWREVAFGDVLDVVARPAAVEPNCRYQLVNAKRNRGGIVPRGNLLGKDILTKTQFYVHTEDFLISRRQIIHGACGIVPESLDGALVSNEYSALIPKEGLLLAYFGYFSHSIYFQQTCFHSSVGVAIEKMVFKLEAWLRHRFYLPPVAEQRRIVAILSTLDRAIDRTASLIEAKRKLKAALAVTGLIRPPGAKVGVPHLCGPVSPQRLAKPGTSRGDTTRRQQVLGERNVGFSRWLRPSSAKADGPFVFLVDLMTGKESSLRNGWLRRVENISENKNGFMRSRRVGAGNGQRDRLKPGLQQILPYRKARP